MNKIIENRGDVSFAYAGITDSIHIITAEKTFSFNGLCDILIDFKDSDRCAIIPLNNKIGTAKNMPIAQMIKTAICTKIFLPFKQWTGVVCIASVTKMPVANMPIPNVGDNWFACAAIKEREFSVLSHMRIEHIKRLLKNSCSSCIDFTSLHRILSFFFLVYQKKKFWLQERV